MTGTLTDTTYNCLQCVSVFSTSAALKYHVDLKHVQQPFRCKLCKDILQNKVYLYIHIKKVHDKSNIPTRTSDIHSCPQVMLQNRNERTSRKNKDSLVGNDNSCFTIKTEDCLDIKNMNLKMGKI